MSRLFTTWLCVALILFSYFVGVRHGSKVRENEGLRVLKAKAQYVPNTFTWPGFIHQKGCYQWCESSEVLTEEVYTGRYHAARAKIEGPL